jgi:fumarate reductase subunit C
MSGVRRLPDFDLIYSVDDKPQFAMSKEGHSAKGEPPIPAFAAIRCWQRGFMSFPLYGSHVSGWSLAELDPHIDGIFSHTPRPIEQRKPQVIFRGGDDRGCSFPPDLDAHLDLDLGVFLQEGRPDCGRLLLKDVAARSGGVVDYGDGVIGMREQEDQFKYMISVEGWAGWTDRLSDLLLYDVGLMVQEHPCQEWYEHPFKPFVHFIPVSNSFDNLLSRVAWAERHPRAVKIMIEERRALAKRVLRTRGLLTFSAVLVTMLGQRLNYKVELLPGAEVIGRSLATLIFF